MALPRPTARRTPLPQSKQKLAPAQRARLHEQARRLANQPAFAQRLKLRSSAAGMPAWRLAATGLAACAGAVGLFIAWLQASVPLALGGAALAATAGGLAWRSRSRGAALALPDVALDLDAAERLDALVDSCAGELPAAALETLRELAVVLGRMAPSLQAGPPGPPWRMEDTVFLGQLLRRYVPDTLQHYLQIPAAQRAAVVMEDGRTPAEALTAQLAQLREELAHCERRLAEACAERLALQGAFLESRRRH
jgi:hypothetical protein